MKTFRERSAEQILYILGLIFALLLFAFLFLIHSGRLRIELTGAVPPCLFYRVSGLYCPGCGGTRAIRALLEGDLIASFLYHPFAPYVAVLYALFMISHTVEWIAARKKSSHETRFMKGLSLKSGYLYAGILLILLQWMVKNLLVVFGIHL